MHINPEWAKFVNRLQKVLAERPPGAPIIVAVPQFDRHTEAGVEGHVDLLTFEMQAQFFPVVIIHLVDSFLKECPNLYAARRLKTVCDKLLGTIEATDITNGMN